MNYYPEVKGNPEFSAIEKEILQYWNSEKIFEESVNTRSRDRSFVFYDGPPFANGLPHYGHLLTGFIKDAVARYKTMRGFRVERKFGWDCHGLPAEMLAEKELGVSGKVSIESFGIDKFNDYCRSSIMRFTQQWKEYVERQGRWVDFENGYRTMDKSFMESVMWAFHELWHKGLVYESVKVVPYSWACQTPLSNFETKMDNAYREKVSKSVTVRFKLSEQVGFVPQGVESCSILAWTTTPWTLVSNFALAINTNMDYVGAVVGAEMLIFSAGYLDHFMRYCERHSLECAKVVQIPAKELLAVKYMPPFPYFADSKNAFMVLDAEFVAEGAGTGIVHLAPGFGEDDFLLCKQHGIPNLGEESRGMLSVICPIDDAGRFTAAVGDFAGQHVFDVVDAVIRQLKEKGLWFATEQCTHSYPHCWRTDTPLIYRATSSWYVEVTKLKARMVELNKEVNWVPEHVQSGQFGKWLDGAKDWSVSRHRFWGAPVPVWRSDDPKYPRTDVYGSIKKVLPDVKALEEDFGPVEDLHRPYIDNLVRPNPDDPTGKSMMRRVPDVLDCWFESGSMPYAQMHYPFENKEFFDSHFPADFITEYIAQTRGWFYTLFVLSTGLFDRHPFKSCICHGVVLDIKGQKLSKRLNNYPDPMEMFEKYGADSVRFTMLSHAVSIGGDLLLDQDGDVVRDTLKSVVKPIWNSYSFFTVYANSDQMQGRILESLEGITNIMDQYILYECACMVVKVLEAMESSSAGVRDPYNIRLACAAIVQFSDKLNNWYIRGCRGRFWMRDKTADKSDAYNTLYTVLYHLARTIAPFLPFIAESIWLGLSFQREKSVHLADFPDTNSFSAVNQYQKNAEYMQLAMDVCSHVLSLRNAHNIRVRQPLRRMVVYPYNCESLLDMPQQYRDIILNEVNVKSLQIASTIGDMASFELKLNFALLGQRVPEKVKQIITLARAGVWEVQSDGSLLLGAPGCEQCVIQKDEFSLNLKVHSEYACQIISGGVPVGVLHIDHELTRELLLEGIARDVMRLIQQARKDCGLEMLDHAEVIINTDAAEIIEAISIWYDFIKQQTFSHTLEHRPAQAVVEDCSKYTKISGKDFDIFLCKSALCS
ncbi:isoleucine--tRNA ligase [Anaplasma marginale]|uniref:isoleucine--tRNA ligase n=1 Tax=Anaplasma marginale TaxID=770 RepID=UPI00123B9749|nr:isoleucine--tRNA ligase [Anaplasma marginale]KAA8472355.1 isoleucine--tRNA ligase [Anaplasma marginale]KAB0450609.1 isoleucine--tRNA ligase [Anaplasma marginale]